jgi:GTP cyclohydrolase IB
MTTTLDPKTQSVESPAPLADVQNSPDRRQIRIDKVGVKNIEYPIVVKDRANGTQSTVGTINMYVDLPAQFKGTHMSRFLEVLNAHEGPMGVEEIPDILEAMRSRLDAQTAHFKVTFPYFIEKKAPVTGARGVMPYVCGFDACAGSHHDFVVQVDVPVNTLCPCSKEISARGAHNQRSIVRLRVRFEGELWIEELIEWIEASASCDLYPVLKRQDEKYVTEKAYDNPRFVEDLSREVTLLLRRDPRIRWFAVEVENYESIHAHNAYAYIEQWLNGEDGKEKTGGCR